MTSPPPQELRSLQEQILNLVARLVPCPLNGAFWELRENRFLESYPRPLPAPIAAAVLAQTEETPSPGPYRLILAPPWGKSRSPVTWALFSPIPGADQGGLALCPRRSDFVWTPALLSQVGMVAELYGSRHAQLIPGAEEGLDLSYLHHELRAPLSAIIGFARMLKDELYGPLNPKQQQYVQGIASSGDYLLSLVNDVLDWSKLSAQQEELFCEWVAVEDLCLAVIFLFKEKAKSKGLALDLSLAPEAGLCWGDQKRLKQILINLLSNAVKFTETGAVTLAVYVREQTLYFAVQDTGVGISPQDQNQLFQPFRQIPHSLNRREKGTGLGLALSRKLARLHGGDITCFSQPGQGSCFTLQIPLRPDSPAPAPLPPRR
ncbi:MAG: hypothetical protein GC158_13135 [Cyanobacteria bacterium RI_101]|nr:hypothetical protein [Cyanobacteria bacterium RI_101]